MSYRAYGIINIHVCIEFKEASYVCVRGYIFPPDLLMSHDPRYQTLVHPSLFTSLSLCGNGVPHKHIQWFNIVAVGCTSHPPGPLLIHIPLFYHSYLRLIHRISCKQFHPSKIHIVKIHIHIKDFMLSS